MVRERRRESGRAKQVGAETAMGTDDGDDADLAQRLTALYPAMRRLAAIAADSDIEPDDLVQEAFARVLAAGRATDEPGDLSAYVRRTIFNLRANERRSKARAGRAKDRLAASLDGEAVSVFPSDAAAVLDSVPASDRTLIFLVDVERLATADAAVVIGISAVAARARLSRARKQIRTALASMDTTDDEGRSV